MPVGTWKDVASVHEMGEKVPDYSFLSDVPAVKEHLREAAAKHYTMSTKVTAERDLDRAVYEMLFNGTKEIGWDGVPLFAHNHPCWDSEAGNYSDGGAGQRWILLDTMASFMGIIVADHGSENYTIGPGHWQGAWMSNETPTATTILRGCAAIGDATDSNGYHLGLRASHAIAFNEETYMALRRAAKGADLDDILVILRAPITITD